MIYCIPLDEATEEFYASVARAAGLPIEQVLRDTLFKLAGELALEALARSLSSLDAVDEVRFLVDGEFAASYGSVDISEPYLSE